MNQKYPLLIYQSITVTAIEQIDTQLHPLCLPVLSVIIMQQRLMKHSQCTVIKEAL